MIRVINLENKFVNQSVTLNWKEISLMTFIYFKKLWNLFIYKFYDEWLFVFYNCFSNISSLGDTLKHHTIFFDLCDLINRVKVVEEMINIKFLIIKIIQENFGQTSLSL